MSFITMNFFPIVCVVAFKGIVYRPPMPNLRPEATNEASKRVDEAENSPKQ